MRGFVALIAVALAIYLAWPSADCGGLIDAECERLELINAGAID